ncbi:phosphoribosylanthranilate isomerase [Neisseria sp.]|uniref:phosphoribosylanthranilate isomerase n=1 Tax=Neisseria sp. TaxID=192066 RepID=UPI00359F5309
MSRIRIKICGITRPEDAKTAAALGVDAVGLVFYDKSKRSVGIAQAQEIVRALPPFVAAVALFVNETAANIEAVLEQVPIDIIQFHGDEPPEFCRRFRRPYLKAVRVRTAADITRAAEQYPDARALLLDAYVDGEYGGTGESFDWTLLPAGFQTPWILAGGLTPDNVAEALRVSGAKAVDVSGGVESAAGVKSAEKMAAFLVQAKAVKAV